MIIDLAKALSTPAERKSQLELSKRLAAEFRQQAAADASPEWRGVWLELAELHEAAIRRLEAMTDES